MPDCDPYAMSEPAYLSLFRDKLTQRAKMASTTMTPRTD